MVKGYEAQLIDIILGSNKEEFGVNELFSNKEKSMTDRTIRRVMRRFEQKGLITIEKRSLGRGKGVKNVIVWYDEGELKKMRERDFVAGLQSQEKKEKKTFPTMVQSES